MRLVEGSVFVWNAREGSHTLLLGVVDRRTKIEKRHCGREIMVISGLSRFPNNN